MNEIVRAGIVEAVTPVAQDLADSMKPEALDGAAVTVDAGGLRFTFSCSAIPQDGKVGRVPLPVPDHARTSVVDVYHTAFEMLLNGAIEVAAKEVLAEMQKRKLSVESESTVTHTLAALVIFGYLRRGSKRGTCKLPEPGLLDAA